MSISNTSTKMAIDGGPKAVTNRLVGWPRFDESAIQAVESVLRSGKVNYWDRAKRNGIRKAVRQLARKQIRH